MVNIYRPVYKSLESEIIDLMFSIHMDDAQMSTYSSKIIDIILRAATEIESIAKDLYQKYWWEKIERKKIKYDHDALEHLIKERNLDKKLVIISHYNCHFSSKRLYPFFKNYKKENGKYTFSRNDAYQSLKHDRSQSLQKWSLANLFSIMSALFILNLYFRNEKIDLEKQSKQTDILEKIWSNIFSIKVHNIWYDWQTKYRKNKDFDECVYLIKRSTEWENKYREAVKKMHETHWNFFINHPKFHNWLEKNKANEGELKKLSSLRSNILWQDEYVRMLQQSQPLMAQVFNEIKTIAVLNKNDV